MSGTGKDHSQDCGYQRNNKCQSNDGKIPTLDKLTYFNTDVCCGKQIADTISKENRSSYGNDSGNRISHQEIIINGNRTPEEYYKLIQTLLHTLSSGMFALLENISRFNAITKQKP